MSVQKRAGGYAARWRERDAAGVPRHRQKSFRTRKEARDFETFVRHRQRAGVYAEPSPELTGAYLDRWAAELGPGLAPSSVCEYRQRVKHRYGPLRAVPLKDLDQAAIRRCVASWGHLAAETQRKAMRTLRTALRRAVADRLILADPTEGVKLPPAPAKPKRVVWTGAQIDAFLSSARADRRGLMWRVMFAAFLRVGELAVLRWGDLDLAAGELHVRRTLARGPGGWYTKDRPKSDAGRRTIPLRPELVAELRAVRCGAGDDALVFRSDDGDPLTTQDVRNYFGTAVRRSGLPRLTPHGAARHSQGSRMVRAGVPIRTVSELLGHSDPAFTLRMYVHTSEGDHRAAIDALYEGEG